MTSLSAAPESPSKDGLSDVYSKIERYYSDTLAQHGANPLGVDWSCAPTQEMRFVQLLKLCDFEAAFSLNDIGCGYGALLGFLGRRHRGKRVDYLGVDLSSSMVAAARSLWPRRKNAAFAVATKDLRVADYSVASGIFNVKLDETPTRWAGFVRHTLDQMHAASRKGFAVNFLSALPRGTTGPKELYRTPAALWKSYCADRYHSQVNVLSSYGMREFTLLVRY